MIINNNTKPSYKNLILYSFPALPLAFTGIPLYIYAPDYYAVNFDVSIGSLGIILLLLRIIDAFQDPLIGVASDRFVKYRNKIILLSAILIILSFFALFQPNKNYLLIWFSFFIFLSTTCFSIFTINLNTLGGLWTKNKNAKTIITSWREAFGMIGLLLAVILPAILKNIMPAQNAFMIVAWVLTITMLISMTTFSLWQKKHSFIDQIDKSTTNIWQDLNEFRQILFTAKKTTNKNQQQSKQTTKEFFKIYAISMLASSMPAVLLLFFIRDRLMAENYTGLFLFSYFVAGACGMPIWQYLSKKTNKYNSWQKAMLLAISCFIWACFLKEGDIWQYLIICILSGIAFGADLTLPPSILSDYIHHNKSERIASLHFSILAFLAKISLAAASAVSYIILDMVNFNTAGINSEITLITISILYAGIPCIIKLIAVLMIKNQSRKKK